MSFRKVYEPDDPDLYERVRTRTRYVNVRTSAGVVRIYRPRLIMRGGFPTLTGLVEVTQPRYQATMYAN